MNKIIRTEQISPNVKLFEIDAPLVAKKGNPGQFIILRINEYGERIPLTIADTNIDTGTITTIVQGIGKTTNSLLKLDKDDYILDLVGPLGKPTHIENYGTVVVIGGGVGTAIAYPTAKILKKANNKVIVIIGGKSKEYAILGQKMQEFADEVHITTDDGSSGMKGLVTDKLQRLINDDVWIDFVLAIGPIPMMANVAKITRPSEIKTVVSLNPIMLDGTGMCGGCRAIVGGKNVFVCVDGPEFDAHEVDFDILAKRNKIYLDEEHIANCKLEKEIAALRAAQ